MAWDKCQSTEIDESIGYWNRGERIGERQNRREEDVYQPIE